MLQVFVFYTSFYLHTYRLLVIIGVSGVLCVCVCVCVCTIASISNFFCIYSIYLPLWTIARNSLLISICPFLWEKFKVSDIDKDDFLPLKEVRKCLADLNLNLDVQTLMQMCGEDTGI